MKIEMRSLDDVFAGVVIGFLILLVFIVFAG